MLPKIDKKGSALAELNRLTSPSPLALSKICGKYQKLKSSKRYELCSKHNKSFQQQTVQLNESMVRRSISSQFTPWQLNRQRRQFQVKKTNLPGPGTYQTILKYQQGKIRRKNANKHRKDYEALKQHSTCLMKKQEEKFEIGPGSYELSPLRYKHEGSFSKRQFQQNLKNQNEKKRTGVHKASKKTQQTSMTPDVFSYVPSQENSLRNSIILQLKPLQEVQNQAKTQLFKNSKENLTSRKGQDQNFGALEVKRLGRISQHIKRTLKQSTKQNHNTDLIKSKSIHLPGIGKLNQDESSIYERKIKKQISRIIIDESDYLSIKYSVPLKVPKYSYFASGKNLKKKLRENKNNKQQRNNTIRHISQHLAPHL